MGGLDDLLIGQSAPMREIKRLIELAAPSSTTILVQGETGTGKELVARAVHNLSGRKGKLVSVNCSAIPSELLESELFGHEKGPLPVQKRPELAALRWLLAVLYFWMRLAICRLRCKPNCYAHSKIERYSEWAVARCGGGFPFGLCHTSEYRS